MPTRPSSRPAGLIGLLLLACWLGWTTTSVAAIGQRPAGDEAAVLALLDGLRARGELPATGAPLAIRLDNRDCNCSGADGAWQQVTASVRGQAGHSLVLQQRDGPELLLLGADGSPLYAGPLSPSALACGRSEGALASWLPTLLSGRSPPLFLPSRCSC